MSYMRESGQQRGPTRSAPSSSNLVDVLNVVLDKGIVIDAWARISVVGIEILTIEARVVVASVETYLRYAEAIGLTPLAARPGTEYNGQQPQRKQLSEDEVLGYLSEHRDGMRLGDIATYFDASRREVGDVLQDLVEEGKVQKEHQLYLPSGEQE
jgi:gas vesicle structural protein